MRCKTRKGFLRYGAILALGWPGAVLATETTTYTYDALGRLVESNTSGTVNNGLKTQATLDAAGNRQNYTVTGASGNSSSSTVIVLPINGYTIIPLGAANFGL